MTEKFDARIQIADDHLSDGYRHASLRHFNTTFATPVLTRPLELGADFVMESLTKMIGGHSDVLLGAVSGRDPELLPSINQVSTVWGLSSSPFDTWLAHRGLSTLPLRMKAASANAAGLADWLALQLPVMMAGARQRTRRGSRR